MKGSPSLKVALLYKNDTIFNSIQNASYDKWYEHF